MRVNMIEVGNLGQEYMKAEAGGIRDEAPWNDISTRVEHNEYQRKIWSELCRKVAQSKTIPGALFNPPE